MQLTMLQESFFFLPSYKYAEIWALKVQLLLWTQRWRRRQGRCFPCFSRVLPRPQQSWFDTIHYFDPTIPGDYFRHQLRLNRNTFSVLLNILCPHLRSQNVKRKNLRISELTGRFITRKTIFVHVVCKCRAPRQDDSTFEDLSLWTSSCALWDK